MGDKNLFLGIDTSNYTSSVAVVNEDDEIIEDSRILLTVKSGERGLRQSEALYQHWDRLPKLLDPLLRKHSSCLTGICVSSKPRPIKDSYMPVFGAGIAAAKIISAALSIPLFLTTHQEGHFKAGIYGHPIQENQPLLAAHLSGGTLELVLIKDGSYSIVGGTKDISYGQLLDRTGVLLGLAFPSGPSLDRLALELNVEETQNPLKPIFVEDTLVNLSGIETQVRQLADSYSKQELAGFLLDRIADSFIEITEAAKKKYKVQQIIVTGGVAASTFLRHRCKDFDYSFAQKPLCSDNAVGVALMKGHPFCL